MDLGATLCTRTKPQCEACPVNSECLALKQNNIAKFPFKKIKKTIPTKTTYFIILINNKNQVLLERRPELGIWGGLWSFPETDNLNQLPSNINIHTLKANKIKHTQLEQISHTFSHYKLLATPIIIKIKSTKQNQARSNNLETWHGLKQDLNNLNKGLPAPIQKLLIKLKENIREPI